MNVSLGTSSIYRFFPGKDHGKKSAKQRVIKGWRVTLRFSDRGKDGGE